MDRKWDNQNIIKDIITRVVNREEWGASKRKKNTKQLKLPVNRIVFSNTNTRPCYSKDHCIHDLQVYLKNLSKEGFKDLPYNFLIGKDGNIYEGTGWRHQPEKPKPISKKNVKERKGQDDKTINIAFINDKDLNPSMMQIKRAMGLIIQGIKKIYISKKPKFTKDQNCQYLFSISDFKETLLDLLGEEKYDESVSEESEPEEIEIPERIEQPFSYYTGYDSPDELEYEKIKYQIREFTPDFF